MRGRRAAKSRGRSWDEYKAGMKSERNYRVTLEKGQKEGVTLRDKLKRLKRKRLFKGNYRGCLNRDLPGTETASMVAQPLGLDPK